MLTCIDCDRPIHRPASKRGPKPKRCDDCRVVAHRNKVRRQRAQKDRPKPQPVAEREPPSLEWSERAREFYEECAASGWWPRLERWEVVLVRVAADALADIDRCRAEGGPTSAALNAWEKQRAAVAEIAGRYGRAAVEEQYEVRPENVVDMAERFG